MNIPLIHPRSRAAARPASIIAGFITAAILACILTPAPIRAQDKFLARNFRVRIAIEHEIDHLAIQGSGVYQVVSSKGKPICNLEAGKPFFVQITRGKPGERTYRLVLCELNVHQVQAAIDFAKDTKEKYQLPVKVLRIPARNPDDSRILVTMGEFSSLDAARTAVAKYPAETINFIYEDPSRAKEGQVRLMSPDGSILASDGLYLRLVPFNLAGDELAMRIMKPSEWSTEALKKSRRYRGEMELTINEAGTLTAVNDLWIEYYLYSVVAAEIGSDAPDEALKAQAVAGRSEAVAKIQRGIVSGSFFDFFDTAMCQAYPGKGTETARVRKAVDSTRGEILVCRGEAVDAVYSHACGGVIASAEDMWDGGDTDALPRRIDRLAGSRPPDLTQWSEAYKWTSSPAEALCNPKHAGYPSYARKFFQWEKSFSGEAYSRLANASYGTGRVKDVIVMRRTPSGRVRQIKIVGENKTVTVKRELELRSALGDIYSNFITFERSQDASGYLNRLVIHGAGFGHGVGMCQMGAFVMGLQGYNYRQILAHYYNNVKIRRLYR